MPDPVTPPPTISPTGEAVIPAKATPFFAAGAALCTAVAGLSQIPGLPFPPWVFGVAAVGATLFTTLLGLTPGWRKPAGGAS